MLNFIKNKLKKYLYNAPVFSLPVEWETVEEEDCEPEPGVVTLDPLEVIENLQEMEDDGEPFESIEEVWPDYPTNEDYFYNEDEL